MRKVALILTCVFLSCAVTVSTAAERKKAQSKKVKYVKSKYGVKALIELGKSMGDMAEELKQDTKNYRKVTKAIDHETIKKGESASKVEKAFGEPVIILSNEKEKVTKWIYKPGNVTFFENKKVYLIFDEDNKLADWITMNGKGQ
ncbi:MAG: hypothetical protein WBD04_02695 [Candidatus Omnitrophota bacterium]